MSGPSTQSSHLSHLSRREFVNAAALATAAAALPAGTALGQAKAKYRRLSISDPALPPRMLDSYKKAIRAMLLLPPSDPRNWYRNALVHTLDCPHGNWWFLVWHRGYIGWFEQTCRELSGDPEFALPYWDWTREPRVPAAMFDDVLTPTDGAYISTLQDFKAQFETVVADYWSALSDDQIDQLLVRGLRFPDDLWFDIGYPKGPYFFDQEHARGLTKAKPDLDDRTTRGVSLPTLLDALGPRDFVTFGSPKTFFHSGLTGFGVLEGQPHNRVHNCVGGISFDPSGKMTNVGGFMQANLSPVDPLFFLHHANIDRLWDVWTRKQAARGNPILPQGYPAQPGAPVPPNSDFGLWSQEPFLFFTDAQGQPVTKNTAGDYATIGAFDYDYQPGSGEEVVPPPVAAAAAPAAAPQRFAARIAAPSAHSAASATGTVTVPPALLESAAGPNAPRLFAQVTVALPPLLHGREFALALNAPENATGVTTSSPHFVATLAMFGHHIMHAPVTFTVPLSGAVASLRAGNLLAANAPLNLRVVPAATPVAPTAAAGAHAGHERIEVLSIVVEAH